MSDHVELTNPVDLSVGGMNGHLFRRAIHLAMSALPFIYFEWGESISEALGTSEKQAVSLVIIAILAVEALRLKLGVTIFGQREYEAKQVSALAWGTFGIGMVFLLTPTEAYAWEDIYSFQHSPRIRSCRDPAKIGRGAARHSSTANPTEKTIVDTISTFSS